jgi:formylglycine-generating enzyme required for sulfatase activity
MTDAQRLPPPGKPPAEHMVWIPGGTFLMGSNDHYPEEAPAHTVSVGAFWIEQYAVTNANFRRFVECNQTRLAARTQPVDRAIARYRDKPAYRAGASGLKARGLVPDGEIGVLQCFFCFVSVGEDTQTDAE